MKKIFFILVFCSITGVVACFADDLADIQYTRSSNKTLFREGEGQAAVVEAMAQFSALKKRGTVWLRTQAAMDKLFASQADGNKEAAEKLATDILRDCRLINNQIALERSRYLLATLKLSEANQASLDAIGAMITAADGEAALALAKDMAEELTLHSDPGR